MDIGVRGRSPRKPSRAESASCIPINPKEKGRSRRNDPIHKNSARVPFFMPPQVNPEKRHPGSLRTVPMTGYDATLPPLLGVVRGAGLPTSLFVTISRGRCQSPLFIPHAHAASSGPARAMTGHLSVAVHPCIFYLAGSEWSFTKTIPAHLIQPAFCW